MTVPGAPEVNAFLTVLATEHVVSASTQSQALSALLFLYSEVLAIPLHDLSATCEAPGSDGGVMYGSGMRVMECCELRVKDVDFDRTEVLVRDGKNRRDRVTIMPRSLGVGLAMGVSGDSALRGW